MRLQFPLNCRMESFLVKGMEVGVARNAIAETAIKMNPRPEYILMIGDDNFPPYNAIIMLYEEMLKGEWDVLAGLYYMKTDPYSPPLPVMGRSSIEGYMQSGKHFIPGEVVGNLNIAGMDFTLIRTSIFDKLGPPPWFKTTDSTNIRGKEGGIELLTEDVFFTSKVVAAGGKVAVHTGVRVSHYDSATGEYY